MKKPFLNPRLIGTRYEEGSVPLDVIREWASFEELVLELARRLYLDAHSDRRRVPRGFIENFALHLSGIGEGSAVPHIDRVLTGGREENPENELYYTRARNLVLAVIAAAAVNAAIPPEFPKDLLPRFDRIGRSLRDDEKIEFVSPDAPASVPAVFNRDTYKRLALLAAEEYQAEAELRGRVTEFDLTRKTFLFSLLDGNRVQGGWTKETKGPLFEALQGCFSDRQKVRLLAFAALDANDRPKRLVEVLQVEPLDPLDVPARLEELKALRRGWLDGRGDPPDPEALTWLAHGWMTAYPASLPNPYVYPTPQGGVQLEWSLGTWELSAEVDLDRKRTYFVAVDVAGAATDEFDVDMNSPDGWHTLADLVRKYSATATQ